jgi:hypothetical protein
MLTVAQQTSLLRIYVAGNNENFSGLHVKYRISFFPILAKLGFSQLKFIKVPSIKFRGNMFTGSRVDTQTDRWTDIYDETSSAIRHNANASTNGRISAEMNNENHILVKELLSNCTREISTTFVYFSACVLRMTSTVSAQGTELFQATPRKTT